MTNGHSQKLRHAKRVRYARMGHQIHMRRLTKRSVERLFNESVASLFSQQVRHLDSFARAIQRTREATEILIAAMNKGAA